MKFTNLFTKTRKEDPAGEESKNAKLLIRAGYIHKEMAGVYSFLPLGLRVINKIKKIIREEMNNIGGVEIKMTALQNKDVWLPSGRWNEKNVDVWFKTNLNSGGELGLAFTHEEAIVNLMKSHIQSHKDLPVCAYQFQTKFRNELRAKSGIMRCREFEMKDLYSFSKNKAEHDQFYEKVQEAYKKIFNRVGIGDKTYMTISSGGSFSKYSHEFQTISDAGEDTILVNEELGVSINKEDFSEDLIKDFNLPPNAEYKEYKSIEVGDIYTLGTRFSESGDLKFKNEKGDSEYVFMGSYGIGVPRLMGAVVEVLSSNKEIAWPKSIAPFFVHLISDHKEESKAISQKIYKELSPNIIWDNIEHKSLGEKIKDFYLMGMPVMMLVSEKSTANGGIEVYSRASNETRIIDIDNIKKYIETIYNNTQ